ncbi:hypothetical protein OF829_09050 [Sphingomonas sp. LB-2]|uniref:hypothetical protein n=1 Tax=Sphingomonas caeni TaxID=2984949 RepID=UPI00222F502B|nr:hypothetical protein [Sphingomonas caeni]MCW3847388.1 hypothetical protein [Sphingomonas caeni]
MEILQGRRSLIGGDITVEDLSSLLWHSTSLRERQTGGRFGLPWESRPAPSVGGLHAMRVVVMPLGDPSTAGEYVPDVHGIAPIDAEALEINRASLAEMLDCGTGTTLQLACDVDLLEACYSNAGSLLWREAGALSATICQVATGLGLTSVMLGRTGDGILRAAGIDRRLVGAGAVQVGSFPTRLGEP